MNRIALGILVSPLLLCALASASFGAVGRQVSVREFGAKGDGKADDTAAFRKALASGNKDIYIPAGVYPVGPEQLKIPDGCSIHGAGGASRLKLAKDTGVLFTVGSGVSLRGFTIDGTNGKPGHVIDGVLAVIWASDVTLDSLRFENCDRACVMLDHGSNVTVRECDFRKVGLGVSVTFSNLIKIQDNTIIGARLYGVEVWGINNWESKLSSDIIISGNYAKDANGLWASGSKRVVMANNIVDGSTDIGLDLEWCEDSTITGNTVRNTRNAGISLFFACKGIAITGNTVVNDIKIPDEGAPGWVLTGIWLTFPNTDEFKGDNGHSDVTIVGNTVRCEEGARKAIWIGSESDNVTVANNTIDRGGVWQGGRLHETSSTLKEIQQGVVIRK